MDLRKIVLIAGALIIALTTALLARSMFSADGASAPQVAASVLPQEPAGPSVLVATKALPVGTIITPDALRFQPWPKELIESAYFLRDGPVAADKLVGSVVRNNVTAGQPITQGSLIRPGERGFLAAALGPGMRAVTVPVSAQSSVAGFIFPGDHIDLVLTQTVSGGQNSGEALRVSETILRNLRVLATDQRTSAIGEDGKPMVTPFSNVTLEVTPKIAEKIAVAQTVGTLSLSLRSIADSTSDLDAAIVGGGVNMPKGADATVEKRALARIAAGPIEKGTTFSTGADVSRFQRATVPVQSAQPAMGPNGQPIPGQSAGGSGIMGGPVVHIARGNVVTDVTVQGK